MTKYRQQKIASQLEIFVLVTIFVSSIISLAPVT
jgi:hypothetical protein